MDVNNLIEMYKRGMYRLDNEMQLKLLDCGNKLHGYDIINRVLILEQSGDDYDLKDVRTKEEWYAIGRKVKNEKDAIYLLNPVRVKVYKDIESGNAVTYSDLSQDEIEMAIKLGMIAVDEETCFMEVIMCYSYENTYNYVKNSYTEYKNICFCELNNILNKLYGLKFTTTHVDNGIYVDANNPLHAIDIIGNEVARINSIKSVENFKVAFNSIIGIKSYTIGSIMSAEEFNEIYTVIDEITSQSKCNKEKYLYSGKIERKKIERAKKMIKILEATSIYVDLHN